ncbi:hypothetical protein [Altererythrobacter sp. Root672]|uniref:hypothetical protein n=1 Tax=Altererythrobacter sp. Root672 TaxID=1736584 RepID=UPI0006FDB0A5|nr:hypothetical protein [Altererythrobacter sp. Root672]KRA80541.1 hypothetical protein ASD76_15380 [Altererythrobacter sp. Root672]
MNLGQGLAFVFSESWAFWRKGWWLALIPTLPMTVYDFFASQIPDASADLAYWSQIVAEAMLTVAVGYPVIRFIALNRDMTEALTISRASARTFAPYLISMTLIEVALAAWSDHDVSGKATLAQAIVAVLLVILTAPWSVTAPSGSTVVGPTRSATLTAPSLFWAILLMTIAFIPISLVGLVTGLLVAKLPDIEIGAYALSNLASLAAFTVTLSFALVMSCAVAFAVGHRVGVRIDRTDKLAAHFE